MLFAILIDFEKEGDDKKTKEYIKLLKIYIPKQKILFSDKRGMLIEKIIYNFSGEFYYRYKKYQMSNLKISAKII